MSVIKAYPKTSFMIINKIYWVVSFFFSVYVIQGEIPSVRQFTLGSIFCILTLPLSYYLTYCFGSKENKNA